MYMSILNGIKSVLEKGARLGNVENRRFESTNFHEISGNLAEEMTKDKVSVGSRTNVRNDSSESGTGKGSSGIGMPNS
jgi:hypothetical protein